MKILTISDTHGVHDEIQFTSEHLSADVLIHAGDWTRGRDAYLEETEYFLKWMHELPFKHKILIAGNHEVSVQRNHSKFVHMTSFYPSIAYLMNSSTTIDGINFWGSPYSNEFCDWAFMEDEWELARIWKKIPDDTHVLITHGPAYGCNDLVNNAYSRDPHVGSTSLAKRKQELVGTLKAHISGHIHEAYGTSTANDITNVCASILDEKYRLVNSPILIEV